MNTVLLVLSQSDVANLPNAAKALRALGTENIWLIYSPAITVPLKDATAAFDKEIADLEKAKEAAVKREDFTGADGLKKQIEGKQLDRKAAIADAWKKVEADERKKIAERLFGPFYEACGQDLAPRPYMTEEHHDASEVANLLNKYQKVNPFGSGNYGIVFARAIRGVNIHTAAITNGNVTKNDFLPENFQPLKKSPGRPKLKTAELPKFDAGKMRSAQELENLHHVQLRTIAENRKVFQKGMPKEAQIKAILDKDLATV